MTRQPWRAYDWAVFGSGILALILAGVLYAKAAVDSNGTCTGSSTFDCYVNAFLGNNNEYVRPHNRSTAAPEFDRLLFPTSNSTPVTIVTAIPATTPGPALGCLIQNTNANVTICVGTAPLVGTPGTSAQCSGGLELPAGQSVYLPAPNGDCGQYQVNIPNVGTASYQIKLVIEK